MKKIIILFICLSMLILCSCDTARSVTGTEINGKGELIVTYSDGTEDNLGVVVGKDGVNGKDGLDGKDGADGKDGVDGKDGAPGKDGIDGKDGAPGKDGTDGKDGAPGKDGVDGEDGRDGVDLGQVDQFNVEINNTSSNTANAVSKAMLSAVSIACTFESIHEYSEDGGSGGSGVIYALDKAKGDALIITNYHVVFNGNANYKKGIAEDIKVFLYGGEYLDHAIPATYVGGSMTYDIALLRIEDSEILRNGSVAAATVADSEKVFLGDEAIAIGNSEGMGISVTRGIISVISEQVNMKGADNMTDVSFRMMRMDTPVNHGNSGGGLFNDKGELIGIVSAKHIENGVEGIGYSIPSNLALALVNNIVDNCLDTDNKSVKKALLGITVTLSNSRSVFDVETGRISVVETTVVQEVSETSLLYGSLMPGDIITGISVGDRETTLTRQYQLLDALLYARVGDTVTLYVDRAYTDGSVESLTLPVVIAEANINTVQ